MRRRWPAAFTTALAIHSVLAWRYCRDKPLPLHVYNRGSPTPATIHLDVVEAVAAGAPAGVKLPFAPKLHEDAVDVLAEPERPELGLWVLRARPLRSRWSDAGPN